jgi:hypothetical protein
MHVVAINDYMAKGYFRQARQILQSIAAEKDYQLKFTRLYLAHANARFAEDLGDRPLQEADIGTNQCDDTQPSDIQRTFYTTIAQAIEGNTTEVAKCLQLAATVLGALDAQVVGAEEKPERLWWIARFKYLLGDGSFVDFAEAATINFKDAPVQKADVMRWLACVGVDGYAVGQNWICERLDWPEVRLGVRVSGR